MKESLVFDNWVIALLNKLKLNNELIASGFAKSWTLSFTTLKLRLKLNAYEVPSWLSVVHNLFNKGNLTLVSPTFVLFSGLSINEIPYKLVAKLPLLSSTS